MDIIEVKQIEKKFGKTTVLTDISMHLESGHIYGIIGHNGSGKTVLLKCICGLYKCDSGSILVNGKELGKDIDMLPNAGIIIEEPGFLRYKSGYHNLEFLYTIRNRNNKQHLYSVMEKVGLEPQMKKPVGKYSLGMRQRLAIGQAIMEDPDILILDEPMNGLDKKGIEDMRKLFMQMKQEGKMILLASHSREDIAILCDEVFELENGRKII